MEIQLTGYYNSEGAFIKYPLKVVETEIPTRLIPPIPKPNENATEVRITGHDAVEIFKNLNMGTNLLIAFDLPKFDFIIKGTDNRARFTTKSYRAPPLITFIWGKNDYDIPTGSVFNQSPWTIVEPVDVELEFAGFKFISNSHIAGIYFKYTNTQKTSGVLQTNITNYSDLVGTDLFYEFFNTKPNFDDDINEEAGGDGNGDNTTDTVTLPSLPTLSATSSGIIQMYAPSSLTLKDFSKYLWSQHIFDNFGKLFQNPIEAILSLSIIPVEFPLSSSSNIMLGNLDSKISSPTVPAQYMELDMGTYTFDEYWGNFLDYAPHTSISIFLPFIGVRELNTNDVMGGTINVKYRLDLLTGMCTAYITVKRGDFNALLYQYTGNCSISIPLTANNLTAQITAMASLAVPAVTSAVVGNPAPLLAAGAGAITSPAQAHVEKTSGTQFNSGYLGVWEPYIIIERPIQAYPKGMDKYQGFTTRITASLGDLSGYTEVEDIHLDNIPATDTELAEIEKLLKEGVIL